jgi:acetolactate synthase I/II/III large subunit
LADVTRKADRLLLLGKAPDFTTGFLGQNMGAADAQVAMIDPNPAEIARGRARVGDRLALAIEADAVSALQRLLRGDVAAPERNDWLSEAAEAIARRVVVPKNEAVDDRGFHPANVAAAVAARLARAPGSILICDGGEFGQWAQTISHTGPRIINGVSGAIGAGIAYAIGASIARPDVSVFALMGDGTAGFLLAEYETALRSGARFVAVIGNDDRWNAEYQIQIQEFGQDRTHTTDLSPGTRYDAAAAGLGAHGEFVGQGDAAALDAALERALAAKRSACLNLRIRPVPAPVVACREPASVPAH